MRVSQTEQLFDDGSHPAIAERLFDAPAGGGLVRDAETERWEAIERLGQGDAVPGGPGACAECHHGLVWHKRPGSVRGCEQCPCPSYCAQGALL